MSAVPPAESSRPNLFARLRMRVLHLYFLFRRPMTLGVRGIVHDAAANSVLLVRHTYVPGWQLPGGGVERAETALEALLRELEEEGNIVARATPALRSIHFNRHASPRDHVAVYLLTDFEQSAPRVPDREIAEARFFAIDDLPEDITAGTRRRLDELFAGAPVSPYW